MPCFPSLREGQLAEHVRGQVLARVRLAVVAEERHYPEIEPVRGKLGVHLMCQHFQPARRGDAERRGITIA